MTRASRNLYAAEQIARRRTHPVAGPVPQQLPAWVFRFLRGVH
jgi:hypothetical protein